MQLSVLSHGFVTLYPGKWPRNVYCEYIDILTHVVPANNLRTK